MRANYRMRRHEGGRYAIFPATIGWQKRKSVLHLFPRQNQGLSLFASGDELGSERANGVEMRDPGREDFLFAFAATH